MPTFTVSPIKGKFHAVKGYAVVRGYGKARETIKTFAVPEHTPEAAYAAAAALATQLNG